MATLVATTFLKVPTSATNAKPLPATNNKKK